MSEYNAGLISPGRYRLRWRDDHPGVLITVTKVSRGRAYCVPDEGHATWEDVTSLMAIGAVRVEEEQA